MPDNGYKLLRDLLTANRAFVCAELRAALHRVMLHGSSPEELPGLERALTVIREYKARLGNERESWT